MWNRQRGIGWRASTGGWPTGRKPRPMRRPPSALTGCPAPWLVVGKSRTNEIQTGEGSEAMTTKRAFISFDFDHDDDLRNALVGQAKYPNSPFRNCRCVREKAFAGRLERQVRRRIQRADLVIVMCGENTHEAEGRSDRGQDCSRRRRSVFPPSWAQRQGMHQTCDGSQRR